MTLAVDLDLTLSVDSSFGPPATNAVDTLTWLRTRGWSTIIHTCKANSPRGETAVADWLTRHAVPYQSIAPKPEADWYLDDRAYPYTNWVDVWEKLRR